MVGVNGMRLIKLISSHKFLSVFSVALIMRLILFWRMSGTKTTEVGGDFDSCGISILNSRFKSRKVCLNFN